LQAVSAPVQQASLQVAWQSVGQPQAVSPKSQAPSPHVPGVQSSRQLPLFSEPVQQPSPQNSVQSCGQLHGASKPLHAPSPQSDPQSSGQSNGTSPLVQQPSPQKAPVQSGKQLQQFSPPVCTPSPQLVAQSTWQFVLSSKPAKLAQQPSPQKIEQSEGHEHALSPPSHNESPQLVPQSCEQEACVSMPVQQPSPQKALQSPGQLQASSDAPHMPSGQAGATWQSAEQFVPFSPWIAVQQPSGQTNPGQSWGHRHWPSPGPQ